MANYSRGAKGAASGATMGAKLGTVIPGVGNVVGALGGGLLGGLAGLFGGNDEPSPAELAAQELKDAWAGTIVLSPEERRVRLDMLKDVGKITPEMEQEILQQDSELAGLKVDPRMKAAQLDALNSLSAQGREGLMLEDRVALEDIQRKEDQDLRGQEEAILQNMQARGMGGAGAELAARLQASQSSADRASQQGARIAAMQQGNRMKALSESGQLAGNMGQQDFNNQSSIATAQDAINRFNTGSKQNVQSANVGARNQAQSDNIKYAKELEANRVATINKQRENDVNSRVDWANASNDQRLGRARASAGVVDAQMDREARNDAGFSGTLGALGGIASTVADTKWEMPEWLKAKAKGSGGGGSASKVTNKMNPGN